MPRARCPEIFCALASRPMPRNFFAPVSNTYTHATRTRTGTHAHKAAAGNTAAPECKTNPPGLSPFPSQEPLLARPDDDGRLAIREGAAGDLDRVGPGRQRGRESDPAVRHRQILVRWRHGAENVVRGQVNLQRRCHYRRQRHVRISAQFCASPM
jgi:hypothetical protein